MIMQDFVVFHKYGHLVQNSGIKLYRTDVHGTIIIATDGVNYEIATRINHEKTISEKIMLRI